MKRSQGILILFTLFVLPLTSLACKGTQQSSQEINPQKKETLLASGTIRVAPELRDRVDPLAVLFIIALNPQGQISAVQKLLPPFQFPLAFTLTEKDQMIAGMPMPEEIRLKIRLDKDGNANPDQAGDLLGFTDPPLVKVGSKGLGITLNKIIK